MNVCSKPTAYDAAIVGCGVVGLVAALVLANAGFRVAIVGPKPSEFKPGEDQLFDPRVFALSHRSQRMLDQLRIWEHLPSSRFQSVHEMQVWGGGGTAGSGFLRFNASDTGVSALTWIVEQSALLDVLLAAARYQPGIDWLDCKVQGLYREGKQWMVQASQAVFGVPLLVVADGAHSQTRRQVGLEFEFDSYSAEGVVATWEVEYAHHGVARQWFDGPSILAMLPLPGPYVSMVWSRPLADSQAFVNQSEQVQIDSVLQAANCAVADYYGSLKRRGGVFAFPLIHGVAPLWFENGAVLMGDAAHVVHPLAGQGLNLGLEDVAELAQLLISRKIRLSDRRFGLADESFWRAWERRRKAACGPVHWVTDGLHDVFRLDLPGASWIRNKGMTAINNLPMLKRWLSQQAMR